MTAEAVDLFGVEGPRRRAMGSHESATRGTDTWLTPPELLAQLGPFDLDPCAAIGQPWSTAAHQFTAEDDGLRQTWHGRVWLNPPYSDTGPWLSKLADHGSGMALLFARTETRAFHAQVWRRAVAVLFLAGRLHFHYPDGRRAPRNAGAPNVLVAYGAADALVLAGLPDLGAFVPLVRTGAS